MSTTAPTLTTGDAGAERWLSANLPDLTGRVAVVTGANSGLGLETAWVLASKGAHVVMACRDQQKGAAAEALVRQRVPNASVELAKLDLASLGSVAAFAEQVNRAQTRLDFLFNNAGVMAIPRRTTEDGFEMQLGTNHLGHFALTGHLLPKLRETAGSRIVSVSSMAHTFGRMNFDDLHGERRYERWQAYGQSKLANLLFAFELDRRLKAAGVGVLSLAAHPGYASTGLQHTSATESAASLEQWFYQNLQPIIAQSGLAGALPQLLAATDTTARGGELYGPRGFGHWRGLPATHTPASHARDVESAKRLWDVSSSLTGISYALN